METNNKNPFIFNERSRYVACVGNNGGTDNISILAGFEKTVELICKNIVMEHGEEDTLIYPLVYSCRHSVELVLKIICNFSLEIKKLKGFYKDEDRKKLYTHNIKKLNEIASEYIKVDRRITPLYLQIQPFLEDYYFDVDGDIFKYEKDKKGNFHLSKHGIGSISISLLYTKFKEFMKLSNSLIWELEYYINEYSQKTFTKNLSREDIQQISIECPIKVNWDEQLKPFKEMVKNKYIISNKEFDLMLNTIKSHYEFAPNIGLENKYKSLSEGALKAYVSIVGQIALKPRKEITRKKAGDDWENTLKKIHYNSEIIKNGLVNINHQDLVLLNTFNDIGINNLFFVEQLDYIYDNFDNGNHESDYLLRRIQSYNNCKYILSGMKRSGQISYVRILETYLKEYDINLYEIDSSELVVDFE